MRTIAFYLPQFHTISENDQWWGKGFTEWVNVRTSKPQFKGHIQPEIPYQNKYYNLLDSEVQIEQAKLAKKYGIEGFCYYHYWFEGKLLLEKPMENMLNNSAIDIPFCVCWANETWARTWDGNERDVLISQNYNEDAGAWKRHFEYLLPFFKDKRYIKIGNKPVLIIYKPQLITNGAEMISYWNKLAIEEGYDGLYMGYQHHSAFDYDLTSYGFNFAIEFEPFYTVRECQKNGEKLESITKKIKKKIFRFPTIYDYDFIWGKIISRKPENEKHCPGAFPSWDNTPRRGNKSIVFWKPSPEKYREYLLKRIVNAKKYYNSEFLFINAWNEWAEGAHLEPDENNGFKYLEATKSALIKTGEYKNENIR